MLKQLLFTCDLSLKHHTPPDPPSACWYCRISDPRQGSIHGRSPARHRCLRALQARQEAEDCFGGSGRADHALCGNPKLLQVLIAFHSTITMPSPHRSTKVKTVKECEHWRQDILRGVAPRAQSFAVGHQVAIMLLTNCALDHKRCWCIHLSEKL